MMWMPAMRKSLMSLVALVFSVLLSTASFAQSDDGDGGDDSFGSTIGLMIDSFMGTNSEDGFDELSSDWSGVFSENCWPCSIFDQFSDVVFAKGAEVSANSQESLRYVLAGIAGVFGLVYLGGSFITGDASDMLQRWKTFWILCISVAAASVVLQLNAFNTTWNYIYGPLLEIPMAVEGAFGSDYAPPGAMDCSGGAFTGAPAGAISILTRMREIVCEGHYITAQGMGDAMALIYFRTGFFGSIINLITGLAVIAIFLWLAISFPLRFIDSIIRLGVVGILTPVIVVCAVFKPTRSYVQIAITNVLYAGMLFAFTGILFNLAAPIFFAQVGEVAGGADGSLSEKIADAVVLIGLGVVFSSMIKAAPALAGEFSAFRGVGLSVGDAATGAAGAAASVATKGAGGAAGTAGKAGARFAGKGAKALAGKFANRLGKGAT